MKIKTVILLVVLNVCLTVFSPSKGMGADDGVDLTSMAESEGLLSNGSDVKSRVQTCAVCHGANGVADNSDWPNLAGQKAGYLTEQLKAFRDGTRANQLMAANMLESFSDSDLESIANHYSQLSVQGVNQQLELDNGAILDVRDLPGAHVRARCVSCHGMSGKTVTDVWPNINGQNAGYIAKQLRDYASGARKHPIMKVISGELTDQQIVDVAEYYSLTR